MRKNTIVCIGAALVDESFICMNVPIPGTSNPSNYYRSAGGVARNVAHSLAQLGNNVELITHFGNDIEGKWLMDECTSSGMSLSHSAINNIPTGRYVAVLSSDGDLYIGAAASSFELSIR